MVVYFLFSPKDDEHICSYIYTSEKSKLISYSYDEEYIVKTDEPKIKDFNDLEEKYSNKGKSKKSKQSILIKGEYPDVKDALFFLDGTMEDFKQGTKARKKLPPIINPFDLDFDEDTEDFSAMDSMDSINLDKEIDDNEFLDEFKSDDDEYEEYPDDDVDKYSDDDEDDLYK